MNKNKKEIFSKNLENYGLELYGRTSIFRVYCENNDSKLVKIVHNGIDNYYDVDCFIWNDTTGWVKIFNRVDIENIIKIPERDSKCVIKIYFENDERIVKLVENSFSVNSYE